MLLMRCQMVTYLDQWVKHYHSGKCELVSSKCVFLLCRPFLAFYSLHTTKGTAFRQEIHRPSKRTEMLWRNDSGSCEALQQRAQVDRSGSCVQEMVLRLC